MDILTDEITKNIDKGDIYIYVNYFENDDGNYMSNKINDMSLEKIKIMLETNSGDHQNIIQTEYHFNNIIKAEIGSNSYYYSQKLHGLYVDNLLLIKKEKKELEYFNFPILKTYDYVTRKNITVYKIDNFEIHIIDNDFQKNICMRLYCRTLYDKKKIISYLKNINELINS